MPGKPHILFVCSRNKWRSPTAEAMSASDARIKVRAVGLSAKSPRRLTRGDLAWADPVHVRGKFGLDIRSKKPGSHLFRKGPRARCSRRYAGVFRGGRPRRRKPGVSMENRCRNSGNMDDHSSRGSGLQRITFSCACVGNGGCYS